MTRKWKKEQRTMDGNYEKNGKIRIIRTKGQVFKDDKKIEECFIYGDSYFERTNDHLSFLSLYETKKASQLLRQIRQILCLYN